MAHKFLAESDIEEAAIEKVRIRIFRMREFSEFWSFFNSVNSDSNYSGIQL
jgi:hypothetical protein